MAGGQKSNEPSRGKLAAASITCSCPEAKMTSRNESFTSFSVSKKSSKRDHRLCIRLHSNKLKKSRLTTKTTMKSTMRPTWRWRWTRMATVRTQASGLEAAVAPQTSRRSNGNHTKNRKGSRSLTRSPNWTSTRWMIWMKS